MHIVASLGLRLLLLLLMVGCLFGQVFVLPQFADSMAGGYPEVAYLHTPYLTLAILVVVCVEVGLVAIWRLLSLVDANTIFRSQSFRWVNVIIGTGAVATAVVVGIAVHLFGVVRSSGPAGVVLLLAGLTVGGAAFVLLMVVMRHLLRMATTMRSELAEVI